MTTQIKIPSKFPIEQPPTDSKSKNELKSLFQEQKQKLLHWIFIQVIRLAFIVICTVFLIRIYHFVTPVSWQWLNEDQLQTIDKFLFTGAIGGFIGKNFDKAIQSANEG